MPQKLLNYEVLERLGEGAHSVIYAVSDPATGQLYALKHVLRSGPKDYRFIEQMQAEHAISRLFSHPNLRKTYEIKFIRSLLMKVTEAFLIMEYFDGKPLDKRPPRGTHDTVDTFIQTAQALKALHSMGYAHCDLKPNNILRNDKGLVKVIDFGQGCKIGTVKQRIQGTPDYIAPEQVARKPISVHTDIFNFGATLYWVLTGTNIPTLYTVNRKGDNSFLLDQTIRSPSEFNPLIPPGLSNLVMECVATRPSKRPADMDQVISRLELVRQIVKKAAANARAAAKASAAENHDAPAQEDDLPTVEEVDIEADPQTGVDNVQ